MHTQAGLPYTDSDSPTSTEASRAAAVQAVAFEGPQLRRLICWLLARDVGDDWLGFNSLRPFLHRNAGMRCGWTMPASTSFNSLRPFLHRNTDDDVVACGGIRFNSLRPFLHRNSTPRNRFLRLSLGVLPAG